MFFFGVSRMLCGVFDGMVALCSVGAIFLIGWLCSV